MDASKSATRLRVAVARVGPGPWRRCVALAQRVGHVARGRQRCLARSACRGTGGHRGRGLARACEAPPRRVVGCARVARSGNYPVAEVVRRATMLRAWLASRTAVADGDVSSWRTALSVRQPARPRAAFRPYGATSAAVTAPHPGHADCRRREPVPARGRPAPHRKSRMRRRPRADPLSGGVSTVPRCRGLRGCR